ncbi:helix-turn-helix transcriptional regulator [Nostocaceae cyanobacterium CENA369]|uniref:Helix-turn-helix transcriptional regulator n=1 Tax=Dendronalium phyllosphericum CENA369 TaxID=1725256 RepID=A0A8J7LHZ0_9NOST|nr:AraC family transcriptional regulator [Dendronalium phyllosphericum]MBH8577766.1 helix-turn-helix transcriptional regulator [Dendronalium phyllosphericum CENA369]
MTLILPLADYLKQLYQAEPVQQDSCFDKFDITRKYAFGEGYLRQIRLRDCVFLDIYNCQDNKSGLVESPYRKHPVEFQFFIPVASKSQDIHFRSGEYFLSGSGMARESSSFLSESFSIITVAIYMNYEKFRSFIADPCGELPKNLQHLIRPFEHPTYERYGTITPAMLLALQQILQCPYQDTAKRLYLESKVWELAALMVDQEIQINQDSLESIKLKPSEIERIYYAKEILLKYLDNPPSLIQLAQQVGLNDRKLKEGFRSVFGTTVFGYLHNYRMEVAQNLLMQGQMNVTEVAHQVGYASPTSFYNAFRKKFGVSPKSCHG